MEPLKTEKLDLRRFLKDEISCVDFEFSRDVSGLDDDFENGTAFIKGSVVNHGGYFELSAETEVKATALCARCYKSFPFEFAFQTVQPVTDKLEDEDTEDYLFIKEGFLELDDFFESCIILEKPTKLLCRDNCAGLCSKCGADLNNGDCGCVHKEIDPRLEKLKDFFK